MSSRGVDPPAPIRVIRLLGIAAWVIIALGALLTFVLPGPADGVLIRTVVAITLAVFFVVLCARLAVAAVTFPGRGLSLWFLMAGVLLWAAGAAMVSMSQTQTVVTFPAPGEALFLASYLGMAGYLLLDVPRRGIPTAAIWLEAAVVCGAAVCLAGFAVLTPLADTSPRGGLQLLLAILYPLIDLILATLVLAQATLRMRGYSRRTAALALGFLGLAVADSTFIATLSNGDYSSSLVLDAVWGLSFIALVGGAISRPTPAVARPIERQNIGALPVAGALAVIVLVLHPAGPTGVYVMAPAIVTLACAGARMMLALREAQGAAEAMRLSLTDELTGLPNRRALLAAADEALREGEPLGFMLLDLDGFKDINDSLGHAVGDEVLKSLANRMRTALDKEILVARLGGDEFALLVPGQDELRFFEIAQRVRAVLQAPLRVDSIDLSIDASVGITVREAADTSSTELLRRADIAMYEAKQSRSGVLHFDTSQDGFSRQRLRRGEDLRQAIAENQLVVWYQPQVDARTRQVVAVEALVRWRHPTEGLLSPIAFLPDARRSGLMPAVTEAVLRSVLVDARRWVDAGLSFRVAMNCAPPELIGEQFLPVLFAALDRSGLPGDSLLIEVTEDSFLSEPERAREALYDLRAHDVQVSIDDYGTGFSSLAYLRDLPVQELKMDRSFVSTVVTDERSRMIVQTTTHMAHALGLRLVAEGVEDAATATELIPLGVDAFQGYHLARPMPAAEVEAWVRGWSTGNSVPGQSTFGGVPAEPLARLLPEPDQR
ncbi:putative bifunctional diguanylate cyclase/phosphodiesterase [Pengzhenrongella phosphoraccumulans]|uniref:putative bifunctional diguanylate cyclase/phosphodiesterase n=1 Tax=Pengzhenrongella phosphoraccumulans TaxID=3114394 RepID=UPI00388D8B10